MSEHHSDLGAVTIKHRVVPAILVAAAIAGLMLFFWERISRDSESVTLVAPDNPTVVAELKRARSLQSARRPEEAFLILKTYANKGYPHALYEIGRAYLQGHGTPRNLDKARDAFLQAVEYDFSKRPQTAYELGRLYQKSTGEDCNEIALSWFERALGLGYTKAHVQLARHYERGLGTTRNLDTALHHYEAAAAYGSQAATLKFARLLKLGGPGVAADPERAQYLAEIAIASLMDKAKGGSGTAAKFLGRLYRDGEFVIADLPTALRWFHRSSELGDPGGMHDLARLMLARSPDDAGTRRALAWLRRATSLGHGGAMTAFGRFHLAEKYGLKRGDAIVWLEQGVEAKHPGAMEELARLYTVGDLVPRDLGLAMSLAREGAELGHLGSQTLLNDLRIRQSKPSAPKQTSSISTPEAVLAPVAAGSKTLPFTADSALRADAEF